MATRPQSSPAYIFTVLSPVGAGIDLSDQVRLSLWPSGAGRDLTKRRPPWGSIKSLLVRCPPPTISTRPDLYFY